VTEPPPVAPRPTDERLAGFLLVPLAIILTALILVFFVFFQTSQVQGDSMRPTLLTEDRLFLTKGYGSPRRGDIVVFNLNEGGTQVEVIKRVVGLPGDVVYTKGDLAWVDGKAEPKTYSLVTGKSGRVVGPLKVPQGRLFVLGDNRAISLDSRFIGPIPLTSVIGRAVAIFAPVTRVRILNAGAGG
jgi:signal peptidase I